MKRLSARKRKSIFGFSFSFFCALPLSKSPAQNHQKGKGKNKNQTKANPLVILPPSPFLFDTRWERRREIKRERESETAAKVYCSHCNMAKKPLTLTVAWLHTVSREKRKRYLIATAQRATFSNLLFNAVPFFVVLLPSFNCNLSFFFFTSQREEMRGKKKEEKKVSGREKW
jgi:hypothetical protein